MKSSLEEKVLKFYLESRDFNGIPILDVFPDYEDARDTKEVIKGLIENDIIELYFDLQIYVVQSFSGRKGHWRDK